MVMPAVRMGGDIAEMADLNQPKGYSTPHISCGTRKPRISLSEMSL